MMEITVFDHDQVIGVGKINFLNLVECPHLSDPVWDAIQIRIDEGELDGSVALEGQIIHWSTNWIAAPGHNGPAPFHHGRFFDPGEFDGRN